MEKIIYVFKKIALYFLKIGIAIITALLLIFLLSYLLLLMEHNILTENIIIAIGLILTILEIMDKFPFKKTDNEKSVELLQEQNYLLHKLIENKETTASKNIKVKVRRKRTKNSP